MKSVQTNMRALLLGIASLGLVIRALVPSGYMAAPLSDGWPVTLCPSQAAEFFPGWEGAHAGHHGESHGGEAHDHPGESGSESPSEESSCPLGAYINAAIDLDSESPGIALVEVGREAVRDISIGRVAAVTFAYPRGPPAALPLETLET